MSAMVGPRARAARGSMPSATGLRDKAGSGWESTISSFGPIAAAASDSRQRAFGAASKASGRASRRAQKAAAKASALAAASRASQAANKAAGRSARKAQKMMAKQAGTSRRWPMMAGVLLAGAAVGAVAIMSRRRKSQWDEYDPSRSFNSRNGTPPSSSSSPIGDRMSNAAGAARSSVKHAVGSAKDKAGHASSRIMSSEKPDSTRSGAGTPNSHG